MYTRTYIYNATSARACLPGPRRAGSPGCHFMLTNVNMLIIFSIEATLHRLSICMSIEAICS